MPFANLNITIQELREKLSYDPLTGVIRWLVSPAGGVHAGAEAGCVKANRIDKTGKPASYRYIRLGHEIPAARIAWALHNGEWPLCKILCSDGDTLNLRIANLREANSILKKFDHKDPEQRKQYLTEHRALFPKAWKDSHLRHAFGVSLAQYAEMFSAQGGVCAICKQPETHMRAGKVKALAVDHNHGTGAVRGLLCFDCNTAIGKLKEDRDTLLSAIRYLDKHSDAGIVPFVPKAETK